MNKSINLQKQLMIFGIPFLIIGLMVFIAKSQIFLNNPDKLAIAITLDLVLITPLIYFLLIRKTSIPKTTVLPFLILGIIVCSYILPSENQYYLKLFKTYALPLIELSVFLFVAYNVRIAIKNYRKKKHFSSDFFTVLKDTCYTILPKVAVIPVVTEIAVFYYGFITWRKRKLEENEFSYHKNSGTVSLLVAIIFLIAIETISFHILLAKWSSVAAWLLTFLSIYSAIQLFGFLKSMLKRPIIIENNTLYLRYGIMSESMIPLKEIDSIELFTSDIELDKKTRKLSFLGNLESHNVLLKLKKEQTLVGFYGVKRKFKVLVFYVDDKIEFTNQIRANM